jgi:hypothetical protein
LTVKHDERPVVRDGKRLSLIAELFPKSMNPTCFNILPSNQVSETETQFQT